MNQNFGGFNNFNGGHMGPQQGFGVSQSGRNFNYVVTPTPYANNQGQPNHMHMGQPHHMQGNPQMGMYSQGIPMGQPNMNPMQPQIGITPQQYEAMIRAQQEQQYAMMLQQQQYTNQMNMRNSYTQPNAYPTKQPVYGVPVDPYANTGIMGMGQQPSTGKKYRSKVDKTPATQPMSGGYPGSLGQPGQPTQAQQVKEVVVHKDNPEILERLELLERENIELKEKLNMLIALYKGQTEKFILGVNEKNEAQVQEEEVNGVKTYTLYGKEVDASDLEELAVVPHGIMNEDNKNLAFINAKDISEYSYVHNIASVGEAIDRDIFANRVDVHPGETLYKHLLRIGENKIIKVEDDVKEMLRSESETNELNEEALDKILQQFDSFKEELHNVPLEIVKITHFLIKVRDHLESKDGDYYDKYKYIPVKYIKYLLENLRAEYNDFLKINMNLKQDYINNISVDEVRDPDLAMRGEMPNVMLRTQDEIRKYKSGVTALLDDFVSGIKLLRIQLVENGKYEDVEILLTVNKGYRLYSWDVGYAFNEIENLIESSDGLGIVVPESHKLLYRVLESIMKFQYDMLVGGGHTDIDKDKVIHNTVLRVFTTSDEYSKSVAFKIYKSYQRGTSKPVYVLKKVFQSH